MFYRATFGPRSVASVIRAHERLVEDLKHTAASNYADAAALQVQAQNLKDEADRATRIAGKFEDLTR